MRMQCFTSTFSCYSFPVTTGGQIGVKSRLDFNMPDAISDKQIIQDK